MFKKCLEFSLNQQEEKRKNRELELILFEKIFVMVYHYI